MINRFLEKTIRGFIPYQKIILLLGARQVGKTTLLRKISSDFNDFLWINADETTAREEFLQINTSKLKRIIGNKKVLFFDEAQRIENIGLVLKLLYDNFDDLLIFVSGSSSFYLSDKIKETLTGRKFEFTLFPLSIPEIIDSYGYLEMKNNMDFILRYGLYPEIFTKQQIAEELLQNLVDSYLFKDILQIEGIRKPEIIEKLTQALALQIGSQVSYTELANLIGTTKDTVQKYIAILERNNIIFRLSSFSRNQRKELKFSKKIYFSDVGVRNALINNFDTLNLRTDKGQLWENFLISERIKSLKYQRKNVKSYFWRSVTHFEIDYVEIIADKIFAYEIKLSNKAKVRQPKAFLALYPNAVFQVVNEDNFVDFIDLKM